MSGFKAFILRGNLVELAVAFIMGVAFATVVTTFTDTLMGFIGKIGGQPDFSSAELAGVNVGNFINAVVSFLLVALGVYFLIVVPFNKVNELRRRGEVEEEAPPPEDIQLLREIRDALRAGAGDGATQRGAGQRADRQEADRSGGDRIRRMTEE
jgi:large conductance mechanosensitive channel